MAKLFGLDFEEFQKSVSDFSISPWPIVTPERRAVVDAEVSLREQQEQAFAMSTHQRLGAEQSAPLQRMPTDVIDMIAHKAFRSHPF